MADHHETVRQTPTEHVGIACVRAIARLLARQAAREAFRAARAEAESSDARESLAPATTADEE